MPNVKSAIKRVTVSEKKAAANKSKKTAIRTTIKKAKAKHIINAVIRKNLADAVAAMEKKEKSEKK